MAGFDWYLQDPTIALDYGYAAAYDRVRQVSMFFGGYYGLTQQNTMYEWDGAAFTALAPATRPVIRRGATLAYDRVRAETVLFGGFDDISIYLGDTWTWDGATWTHKSPAHSPAARGGHGMAYDPVREETVLFGGIKQGSFGGAYTNDTWVWDGTDWTQKSPAHKPLTRGDGVSIAWDPISERIIFFSGGGRSLNDTWAWDGTDWEELSPAHTPVARRYPGMASLENVGIVLFGIYSTSGDVTQTYFWTGSDWDDQAPDHHPPVGGLTCQFPEMVDDQPVYISYTEVWTWQPPFVPPPPELDYVTISHTFGLGQ